MKKVISFTLLAVLAVFALNTVAFAGETKSTDDKWNRIEEAYLLSLRHDVNEVVESALLQVAKINLFVDNVELPKLNKEVERLSKNGRTARIRYKAYLTLNVLNNPDWVEASGIVAELEGMTDENRKEFFEGLTVVVNTGLLGE